MIEDPYLGNDFELLLINYKSKTNKLILLYDMYSEFTINPLGVIDMDLKI